MISKSVQGCFAPPILAGQTSLKIGSIKNRQLGWHAADKDQVIEHLREEIRLLYQLLTDHQPWWRRWFR
jgi:hypothetical protein